MDYKKKYKEALEKAQRFYNNSVAITKKGLEDVFPELKESEDDRIRKELICFLETEIPQCNARDKYIAWLEKQGEQNYKIIKGKNYFCIKTHNYAGVEWIKGTKYYASDNYTLVNQGCEYYCPEYSKEEHNNLFEEVKCDGCVEKQGEQKPVEWSEEDERYFNSIAHALSAHLVDPYYDEIKLKHIGWFSSLKDRYAWKPSDEQMEALRYVTNFDYGGHKAPLVSLYEQLKKLREE